MVTGAGRGLGRELALELARRGIHVAAIGRQSGDLTSLAEEWPEGQVIPVVADVANPDAVREAFDQISQRLGPVEILINNAAVYPHRDFLDETPEQFMETVAINLGGMATCSMMALEHMVASGYGRIVNVVSFADIHPAHLSSAYSVSKGAGRILTKAMVTDLADRFPEIVINNWIPGALSTKMGIPDGHDPKKAAKWGAELALWHDPSIMGTTFVENREHLSQPSLKRRIFNALTRRTPLPRYLVSSS